MRLHILDEKKMIWFFLQLPILHSHWFNCEDWLMIPWLQIPKESTTNPHNGSKWQNMQTHPNKKANFEYDSPSWSSIVWKQFFVLLNFLFHSWILVRCVTLTRNLFEKLKNKEIWIKAISKCNTLSFFLLLNHLLKTSTTRHSTQLYRAKSLTWKCRVNDLIP